MRLRSSLLLLSLATAAPLLALSVLAGVYVFQRENTNVVNAANARNRATLEAVDGELRGAIDTLRALSNAPSLVRGDLAAFHDDAGRVLAVQPHWRDIVVSRPDGRQAMNARLPWGSPLATDDADPPSLQAAVATRAAAVGNLTFLRMLGNEPGVDVRLPIERDGRVAWVLTAVLKPEVFGQLLTNQQLPDGWVSGVVGNDGRMIARVPPVPPGTLAGSDYRREVAAAHEGWYRGKTIEGHDTYTAFSRSRLTGWSVGYAIPADAIIGGARGASTLIAAGILLSVASALVIGYWLSRRIADPITDELRRVNDELRVYASEVGEASTNKSRFLALLSHELRNPLAPLRNGLAILKSTDDAQVRAETRSMMERQLQHLTRLIEDLLDVGRIDRGQIALRREPVLLETAVQAAIEGTKPAMDTKQQQLVVRYSPARSHVRGDALRLSQVFINLLGNASKYTPAGGRIEVRMTHEDGRAVVAISDTGLGFTPADAGRIFDMFVRLERPAGHDDPGGLGIGLTLTRSLVELHEGRIEAASEGPGRGATFTVTLPTCEAPAGAEARAAASAAPVTGGRILIADDNVDAAQTFAELLRMEGFDVHEAHDGVEALRSAREFRPHVVFLDLDMPRMSGLEVAVQLRQLADPSRPHLVALTGWGQQSDLAAARAAGFDEHLTKPADPAAVVRIAADAVSKAGTRA
jgi:signal transduction histidine kinase/ActR/RegA family two-component response regulator